MNKTIKIGHTDFTGIFDKVNGMTAEEILAIYPHFHPKVVAEFVRQYPAKKKSKPKKSDLTEESND